MALETKPLQVVFCIRSAFTQRHDVIEFVPFAYTASSAAMCTKRISLEHPIAELLQLPTANAHRFVVIVQLSQLTLWSLVGEKQRC